MDIKSMFDDQRAFNRQIFPVRDWGLVSTIEQVNNIREHGLNRLRHLSLGILEETLEFLRTYEWKAHRKRPGRLENVAHSHEELVDMFKYWLSLADLSDFPIEKLEELYYAKSRVVQYRYQEEWIKDISGPYVLVDIDNVIADYITGICMWAKEWGPKVLGLSNSTMARFIHRLDEIQRNGLPVAAETIGISPADWQMLKHKFRTSGGKRLLPVFPDGREFLEWCRSREWTIILVTSRPIDRYPNIFTDTISWLYDNRLPFDYLWWSNDKGVRIEEAEAIIQSQAVFAVDDDIQFVSQYRTKHIKTYWLCRRGTGGADNLIVKSLTQLMEREMADVV